MQEVYLDLYIIINTSMDLICLMITAALLHLRIRRRRAVFAAAMGGAYAAGSLLLGLSGIIGFLGDAAAAVLLCAIAFGVRGSSVWRFFRSVAALLLTSMLLGGVMTGLYSLLNRLKLPFESMQGEGLSVWTFALLTAVAGLCTVRGGRWLGLASRTKTVAVKARLFGQTVTFTALVDSGNLLRDPISGRSVIAVDPRRLAGILPRELLEASVSGRAVDFLTAYEHARHCRPIPARGATGETVLLAILPEELILTVKGESTAGDYLIAPASLGEAAQGFDAVIGAD